MYTDEIYEDGEDDESPEQKKIADDAANGLVEIIPRKPVGFLTEQALNK
jgi:hypothetical protein